MADVAKNFAKGTLVAGIDDTDTELTVDTGQGLRFPATPFNAVIWNVTDFPDPADDPNVEIVRVTAISTDTLTITRAQEGTAAAEHNSEGKAYQIVAPLTAKVINDLGTIILMDLVSFVGTVAAFDATGLYVEKDAGVTIIGDVADSFNSTFVKVDDDNQQVIITRQPILPGLPSTDPAIAGALYYDTGTGVVKRSAG
jgi:hypothetical protein